MYTIAGSLVAGIALLAFLIPRRKWIRWKNRLIGLIVGRTLKKLTNTKGSPCEVSEKCLKDGGRIKHFVNAPRSLVQWFAQMEHIGNEKDFIVFTGKPGKAHERFTYKEAFDAVARVRTVLERMNVQRGERVAIVMANVPEFLITFMAVTQLGAIAVPTNAFWEGNELEYGIRDSGSSVIFIDSKRLQRLASTGSLEKLCAEHILRSVVVVTDDDGPGAKDVDAPAKNNNTTFTTWQRMMSEVENLPTTELTPCNGSLSPDDDACIMYTSGSTGKPKGVVLTHGAFIQTALCYRLFSELSNKLKGPQQIQRTDLVATPLFHASALSYNFMLSFAFGHKLVLIPRWDADEALRICLDENVTYLGIVPTMLSDILKSETFWNNKDKFQFTNLGTGGAACPKNLIERMAKARPGMSQGTGWGLTETNAIGTVIGGPEYTEYPQSCGKPHVVSEVKLIDPETGEDIPEGPNAEGEVCIRSPTSMRCYWNKPEATNEILLPYGWVRSGDVGRINEDGFVFIVDRVKDLVIRGGENISCAEVESVLHEFSDDIFEASVFGLHHERYGEQLCAAVVLRDDSQRYDQGAITEMKLQTFVGTKLAKFKVPSRIFFRNSQTPLPRGGTGKIMKAHLKEEYASQI